MGKKANKKPAGDGKAQEARQEKKDDSRPCRSRTRSPVRHQPRFFFELVVGNGIGDDAVNDAVEAYRRAWESRREKALEAAQKHAHDSGKNCKTSRASDPRSLFRPAGLAHRRRRPAARDHLELAGLSIGALLPKELTA